MFISTNIINRTIFLYHTINSFITCSFITVKTNGCIVSANAVPQSGCILVPSTFLTIIIIKMIWITISMSISRISTLDCASDTGCHILISTKSFSNHRRCYIFLFHTHALYVYFTNYQLTILFYNYNCISQCFQYFSSAISRRFITCFCIFFQYFRT